jgi:transcriptional regulator with XRE-family HTH domain
MRKSLHLTIEDLSRKSRLSHNVIARLERDETRKAHPWVLGRILPFLAFRFKETFPEANGNAYDFLIPPVSFGAWLQNLRLRRGLKLQELAKLLGVHPYTVIRYEHNQTEPDQSVRLRLKKNFGLNGELDRYF